MVNSYFYQGALQHLAIYDEFRMTRWLKFRIETAGKNRLSALSAFALDSSTITSNSFLTRIKLTALSDEKEIPSRDKASKSLILKQFRNLLSTVFVNAKRIHFSDLHITKDLLDNLMYDKRTIRENTNDRITFRMSDCTVFETVEHISFVGCSFETKSLNFSKCTNLRSVLFQSCRMTLSDIEGMFCGRAKSKSIKLVFHDLVRFGEYKNEDQLTEQDLALMEKMGLNYTKGLSHFGPLQYGIEIPKHVTLVPLSTPSYYDESVPTRTLIDNSLKMYGILSNTLVDTLLQRAFSKDEDDLIENVEMILENGGHLFDVSYRVYSFFCIAIVNHYSNTQLWNLLEKHYFYKLPKFTSSTMTHVTYSRLISDLIIDTLRVRVEDEERACANIELFFVDVYEKNFKKDFTEFFNFLLNNHPSLIGKLAERGFFEPRSLAHRFDYIFDKKGFENKKILEAYNVIENIVRNYNSEETEKRKRESTEETDISKRVKQ